MTAPVHFTWSSCAGAPQASPTCGYPIRFQQPRSVRIGLQYGF